MKTKGTIGTYMSPEIECIEILSEGILCESPTPGDGEDGEDGGSWS